MRLLWKNACVAAVVGFATTGCTFHTSVNQTVSRSTVEQKLADTVENQTGHRPEDVKCPADLAAQIGASLRCVMTDQGRYIGVTVTVTSVDSNGNTRMHFQTDSQPTASPTI